MNNDIINDLIDISIKWRELSRQYNGSYTEYYRDDKLEIRCYFDERSDFTVVGIKFDGMDEAAVSFHDVPQIEFRITTDFNDLIAKAREFYDKMKSDIKDLAQDNKNKKITALKKQLTELEGEEND